MESVNSRQDCSCLAICSLSTKRACKKNYLSSHWRAHTLEPSWRPCQYQPWVFLWAESWRERWCLPHPVLDRMAWSNHLVCATGLKWSPHWVPERDSHQIVQCLRKLHWFDDSVIIWKTITLRVACCVLIQHSTQVGMASWMSLTLFMHFLSYRCQLLMTIGFSNLPNLTTSVAVWVWNSDPRVIVSACFCRDAWLEDMMQVHWANILELIWSFSAIHYCEQAPET